MLNLISVELTPAPNYVIPVQPITVTAEELFPDILSTKKHPLAARDVAVYDNSAEKEYYGGTNLLVTVSVARNKELKPLKDEVTRLLIAALVGVLGNDVDIELRLFFIKAKFTEAAVATSDDPKLPELERSEQFTAGLDRVMERLIMQDATTEPDTSTDALRVISEANQPRASVPA